MARKSIPIHVVILAGGRGTRFWPRSRTRTPKQLLNIVGEGTMIEQTIARFRRLVPAERIWTVTNVEQEASLRKQIPAALCKHVLVEPVGRNTAAAIGLAAFHIQTTTGSDALMAVLPADHYIDDVRGYQRIVFSALQVAETPGRMVVLGIPPTHPETGFGYIERGESSIGTKSSPVFPVRRFTEKPAIELAKQYISAGNHLWNAGMFFWRVSTFLEALRQHLVQTYIGLEELAASIGKKTYAQRLKRIYPKLESISVDYALLERVTAEAGESKVFVIPAQVGWSDIGSWAAVYELLAKRPEENVFTSKAYGLDANGNYVSTNGKFVGLIGIKDTIIVEAPDALLVCPRHRAQDVGRLVKWLEERKMKALL